ncbi:MAG: hypothetical protein WD071_12105 [Pseudohongiella sp.]|uniref:hypothetical protein n=1 Tax=Pseudohongiella sp. TaxID=1979412 RepID=UPI0034A00EA8
MMATQQVNLFLPELRPNREWLTAIRLGKTVAVVLLLMVLLSAWNYWQRSVLRAEMAVAEAELSAQTQRTEQIERDAASRSSNESLLRDIATRETRLQQSQELLEFLRNTTLGNSTGYSEYVKDLSRASFDGIWLTEFRISGGTDSVFLRGNALQTAMVPDYVGRLSGSQSSLQGRLFNRLQSNRVTSPATAGGGELYEFVLETQR